MRAGRFGGAFVVLLAALSVSLAALMPAAAGQVAGATPAFRGGVETVRLDVSVTKNGVPVKGLTAADFTVSDEGAR